MALQRIYDQMIGQLAGILVTTTGKGQIKQDGTEGWAQAVALVDGSGTLISGIATSANQVLEIADLDIIAAAAQSTAPVNTYPLPTTPVSGLTTAMTGTTSTLVTGMGTPAANKFNYITQITIGNSHATVGTFVELQDGNGGTTFYTAPAAAVYGGSVINFSTPLKQPTAATALYVKDTTTGANVIVSVSGFQAAAPT